MIEDIILNYLDSVLDVPVFMEDPESNTPSAYVTIERTGGGEQNQIKRVSLSLRSYGPSLYDAANLNETVKSAMRGAVSLKEISRCELNSDYNFTDTETKRYRYQAIYNLTHY